MWLFRWVPRRAWGWIALLLGVSAIGLGGRDVIDRWRTGPVADWPSVEGRIDEASVGVTRRGGRSGGRNQYFVPGIRYSYAVNGVRYVGGRIWLSRDGLYENEKSAAAVVRAYPAGSSVRVFHAPNDPARAVLRADGESSDAPYLLLTGLAFLGGGYWLLRAERRRAALQPAMPPG